jgi:hypothetical protein
VHLPPTEPRFGWRGVTTLSDWSVGAVPTLCQTRGLLVEGPVHMAKMKRIYSAPLVVTVAAWVGPACSTTPADDTSETGGVGTGGTATGGTASGGKGSGGKGSGGRSAGGGTATGGIGGDGPELQECPSDVLYFQSAPCEPGEACNLPMKCTSGTPQNVVLVCGDDGNGYSLSSEQDTRCDRPFEACVGSLATYDCLGGSWRFHGS